MPLQKQNISLPFGQGVNTKTDSFQLQPGKLVIMQNGYFYTPESIRKRNGYTALAQTGYYANSGLSGNVLDAQALYSRNGGSELLVAGGNFLWSYSPASAYAAWVRRYPTAAVPTGTVFFPNSLQTTPIERKSESLTAGDSSTVGSGLQAYVWQSGPLAARTALIDTASGTPVLADDPLGNQAADWPTYPKVFQLGTVNGKPQFLYIVWEKVGAGAPQLAFYKATAGIGTGYTVTAATAAAVTDVGAINVGNPVFDATLFNSLIYVVYRSDTGAIREFTILADSSRSATQATAAGAGTDPITLSVWGKIVTSEIWISWASTTLVRYMVYNLAVTVPVLGPTTIVAEVLARTVTGIPYSDTLFSIILYERTDKVIKRSNITNTGVIQNVGTQLANVGLASKMVSGEVSLGFTFFWVTYPSATEPGYYMYVMDIAGGGLFLVARSAPGSGGGLTSNPALPEINAPSYLVFQTTFMQADELIPVAGGVNLQLGVMSSTVKFLQTPGATELAGTLHLSGGILSAYDGFSVTEHGFMVYPEITGIVSGGVGGLSAGTYSYVVVFEWTDAQGQIHQSAPSVPFKYVAGAADSAVISYKNMWLTNKTLPAVDPLNVGIYRTVANGTVYFRVNPYFAPSNAFPYTVSDTTITYFDAESDASIISAQQLYTNGGEVDNGSVPATLTSTQYRNRVIVVPADNPLSWWYSKALLPSTPVEFSPLFVQTIDQRGGNITAAAVMDDKLVFFKSSAVFVVTGDGPAPNGTGNDYTQGQLVTTDTGAINSSSVVTMPDGIMFQSAKGIEILERGLATRYIGADVEAYVQGTTVTSAALVAPLNQVRFMLSSGICVVYDYFSKDPNTGIGQWSVFTNHTSVDSTLYNGQFVYVTAGGLVLVETPGLFTDNGTFIQIYIRTAWLSLAGLQGFQRICKAMLLGTWESSHTLEVGVSYDFDTTFPQIEMIPVTTAPANQYQWRVLLNRQKCESIRFDIADLQNGAAGESLRLSAMALEIGAKAGLQKSPQTKTYG